MTDFCQLARKAIAHHLTTGCDYQPETMAGQKAACFVSLHEADGSLRGCMGTLSPTQKDLHLEIVKNAIAAAMRDPRFMAVSAAELPNLQLEVSVLNKPEPVPDASYLDPSIYGVIVQSGMKRGVLLPDLQGIEDVSKQIGIAKRKAGIGESQAVSLSRFEVTKYHES